jgi:hypothetical protein
MGMVLVHKCGARRKILKKRKTLHAKNRGNIASEDFPAILFIDMLRVRFLLSFGLVTVPALFLEKTSNLGRLDPEKACSPAQHEMAENTCALLRSRNRVLNKVYTRHLRK